MNITTKIKVLIVEDSQLFREILYRALSLDSRIEVVGTAEDPFVARDKIIQFEPDVMILDVELPRMNGIEFLKKLMPQYPIPVIAISSANKNIFDAINAGAVDFVAKPGLENVNGLEYMINELIYKIKIASVANIKNYKSSDDKKVVNNKITNFKGRIIFIGASTGGTQAISKVIEKFPKNMPPILIVQHMPEKFTKLYAERLNGLCEMEVREAKDGDEIYPGLVLIAPGDYHMKIKNKDNQFYVHCFKGERVNGHCPSVDVLFESAASLVNKNSIGVILTGMGYDGAKGLLEMKKNGAITIGQDEETSIVYGMPKVAFNIGAVEKQVSLDDIADTVTKILNY